MKWGVYVYTQAHTGVSQCESLKYRLLISDMFGHIHKRKMFFYLGAQIILRQVLAVDLVLVAK